MENRRKRAYHFDIFNSNIICQSYISFMVDIWLLQITFLGVRSDILRDRFVEIVGKYCLVLWSDIFVPFYVLFLLMTTEIPAYKDCRTVL